jgi:hypothetical protein
MKHFDDRDLQIGSIALGGTIMVVGLFFLMDRLDLIRPDTLTLYWPGLLVVFGLTQIVRPSRLGSEVTGMWIALVGGLLLLDRVGIAPMEESWPVFVIVAGLTVVFKSLGWLPSRPGCRLHERPWTEAKR